MPDEGRQRLTSSFLPVSPRSHETLEPGDLAGLQRCRRAPRFEKLGGRRMAWQAIDQDRTTVSALTRFAEVESSHGFVRPGADSLSIVTNGPLSIPALRERHLLVGAVREEPDRGAAGARRARHTTQIALGCARRLRGLLDRPPPAVPALYQRSRGASAQRERTDSMDPVVPDGGAASRRCARHTLDLAGRGRVGVGWIDRRAPSQVSASVSGMPVEVA